MSLFYTKTPEQRGHFALPTSSLALLKQPLADMEDQIHANVATLQQRAATAELQLATARQLI